MFVILFELFLMLWLVLLSMALHYEWDGRIFEVVTICIVLPTLFLVTLHLMGQA